MDAKLEVTSQNSRHNVVLFILEGQILKQMQFFFFLFLLAFTLFGKN